MPDKNEMIVVLTFAKIKRKSVKNDEHAWKDITKKKKVRSNLMYSKTPI